MNRPGPFDKCHANALPEDVQKALLEVLSVTLLSIRNFSKKADLCYAFSDHVHNVPSLIANYSPGKFRYYWEVERPIFIRTIQELQFAFTLFDGPWSILEKHYKSLK